MRNTVEIIIATNILKQKVVGKFIPDNIAYIRQFKNEVKRQKISSIIITFRSIKLVNRIIDYRIYLARKLYYYIKYNRVKQLK